MALFVRIKKQSLQVKEDGNTADVTEEIEHTLYLPFPIALWSTIRQSGRSGMVLLLQAGGQELDFITQRFVGIPYALHHTVWTGEMANFIVMNLSIL